MLGYPDYSRCVSMKLSEVLSDIGVNERITMERRRLSMLNETVMTITQRLLDSNFKIYFFGSQTEGTTTLGLKSDTDRLTAFLDLDIIQELCEQQPGRVSLLMTQDELTSLGYCLLQYVKTEAPLPIPALVQAEMLNLPYKVLDGRVLLKNTFHHQILRKGEILHGPARSLEERPGFVDKDSVTAHYCKTWPTDAKNWLNWPGTGEWPTEKTRRYCETTGCLVVPVSNKSVEYEDLEWRISTSLAERLLMFSLNITQIRCYILMKMILKTVINPRCNGVISSFMCKTVLFHCIRKTSSNKWQEHNLLACLNCCLQGLYHCVRERSCPHFIIHKNNLMAGRILDSDKRKLLDILQLIIQSDGKKLLEISMDRLGSRLMEKINILKHAQARVNPQDNSPSRLILFQLLANHALTVAGNITELLEEIMPYGNKTVQQKLSRYISTLDQIKMDTNVGPLEKSASKLLALPLYSSLGSVIASNNISTNNSISPLAMKWFLAGLNSDVASGRLKLASALHCVGDLQGIEKILRETEQLHELNIVEPICGCYNRRSRRTVGLDEQIVGKTGQIDQEVAFCVQFLPSEMNCIPKELQYEMFRSTQEEICNRDDVDDNWMDMAVVDSLPYLYFLQYKTYSRLQRPAGKRKALKNLKRIIERERRLNHRETALNLLGQCLEQEGSYTGALCCYSQSVTIQRRNNAARVHLCILLNRILNRQGM